MEFVIESCQDDDLEASTSSEPGMEFSFITDDTYDTNILDEESDSDVDEDEIVGQKLKSPNEEKSDNQPLNDRSAESLKDREQNKNSKDTYDPFSLRLLDGLTKNSKKKLLPLIQNNRKSEVDKLLEKSELLNTNMEERTFSIEPPVSKRKLKKLKKEEREKTKGDKWFGLPATEVTEEVKRDLEIMQMRSVLDPKHFYKKNHMKVLPKYFHIGTVQDTPLDYYNNRLTKKERKKTLVDQLMSDAEFNHYNKSKYAEILKEKRKTEYKTWKQGRRMDKKKK